jgi:serine/threonine protein kinase/WD40 repeat protein
MFREGFKIGPYTLLKKLGRGGFGVVWLAEKRTALAVRKVAIKMPNDDDVDLDAVRREAALWIEVSDHPNVLSFIDADIYDEQIIIVSEYAPDGSLATFLKQNGGKMPSTAQAVEMAIGILSGLSHLHSKRIIHRDLKPANILLHGRTPRLVDFGLARVMKSTSHSKTVSGTYSYMPPETFAGSRSEQTDIYSVGVILFEMIVGSLPYPQDNDAALIGAILHGNPEPLPDDLSKPLRAVVERAMERDLNRRFKTALEMRTALHDAALTIHAGESSGAKTEVLPSFLSQELLGEKTTTPMPTVDVEGTTAPMPTAGLDSETNPMIQPQTEPSPSVEIEERKTPQSQPTEVSPTINAQAQTWQEIQAKKETSASPTIQSAEEKITPLTTEKEFRVTPSGVSTPSHITPKGVTLTKSRMGLLIGVGAAVLASVLVLGLGVFLLSRFIGGSSENTNASQTTETANPTSKKEKKTINPTGREIGILQAKSNVYEVAISGDGKLAASVGNDSNVRLWRNEESSVPVILSGHADTVRTVAISTNGQIIASGSDDKTIRLWNASDGKFLRELKGHSDWVFRVSFSEDGQTIVSASGDKTIRFWNVSDGSLKQTINMPNAEELIVNISADLRLVAFYLPQNKQVRVWSLAESRLVSNLQGERFEVRGGAFAPDGNTIALGSKDGAVRLYSVSDGEEIKILRGANQETGRVVYNSSGELISAGYNDGSICLWNADDGKLLKTLSGHTKFVFALAFSSDDSVLASGGEDQTLRLWEIQSKK